MRASAAADLVMRRKDIQKVVSTTIQSRAEARQARATASGTHQLLCWHAGIHCSHLGLNVPDQPGSLHGVHS